MRVLITSDSYLPRLGGAEMHAFKLGLFLQREGHEVRIFTSEPGKESEDQKSPFPVIRGKYSRKPRAILEFYKKLYREVKWADMVYSVYCHKIAAAVGLIRFLQPVPQVISLQGRGILDLPGNNWFFAKLHTFYRCLSLKRADKILASCLEFVDIAKRYTSADKILYLPNALDVEEFSVRLRNYSILPFDLKGRKMAVTVRRLVPKNGIQFLIEAISYVVKNFQNALFFIIGWGRLEDYLKNRVKELGIEKYVYFAGRIENNVLPDFLGLADLVIFPSTAEATSIACLESMALGKPILASKVGGFPEMVQEGVNGYLVNLTDNLSSDYGAPMTLPEEKLKDFANKIIKMFCDDELMENMGRNSRQIAESKFDWHKRIKEIIKIFNELRERKI